MAAKKGQEIATIDVAMVTLTTKDSVELGLKTSTQVGVSSQIETTEAIKLIVKGTLIAQKRQKSIITGNSITMKDNVFNPQLVKILQGGTIEYDVDGSFKKYTPVKSGEEYSPEPFTLNVYSAHYDASGLIVDYEKTMFPNCTGEPVTFETQDDTFRAPEYTIISAPNEGEAPYVIEMVAELPVLQSGAWNSPSSP